MGAPIRSFVAMAVGFVFAILTGVSTLSKPKVIRSPVVSESCPQVTSSFAKRDMASLSLRLIWKKCQVCEAKPVDLLSNAGPEWTFRRQEFSRIFEENGTSVSFGANASQRGARQSLGPAVDQN